MPPDAHPHGPAVSVLGRSPAISEVLRIVERIAATRATVLITGESGTGKELIARAIHETGSAGRPFFAVNCAAIPHGLLEAELFGYEQGAFTDARITKKGLFELAGNGTLFLDEVGLMPLDLQAKLLSVVESGSFRRLGGSKDFTSHARILAATNEDIEAACREGRFRRDLFYRLNVVRVSLPPLRDRADDALLIAESFLATFSERHGRSRPQLSEAAKRWINTYRWPGNIRELRNVIERAVLLAAGDTLNVSDLEVGQSELEIDRDDHPTVRVTEFGDVQIDLPSWGIALEDVERKLIEAALEKTGGNLTAAAQLLHVTRDTLRYRVRRHGIQIPGHE